jgi:hypothetical protein
MSGPSKYSGVQSDHTSAPIGSGGYKTVSGADYSSNAKENGFVFSELPAGASQNPPDYAIISYSKEYDANRLLAEIELQEEFAPHLAPITFAVEISFGGKKYKTVYGFNAIKTELEDLNLFDANELVRTTYASLIEPYYPGTPPIVSDKEQREQLISKRLTAIKTDLEGQLAVLSTYDSSRDNLNQIDSVQRELQTTNQLISNWKEYWRVRERRDIIETIGFRVLMQRTAYNKNNGQTIPVSRILDYDTLNALLNAILDKGYVLRDIKPENLCLLVNDEEELYLGALDYDVKYVKQREYYKVEGDDRRTIGKMFMALMVCVVGIHRDPKFTNSTRVDILSKMGIIHDARRQDVNMDALRDICTVPEFQSRIMHYLVHDDKVFESIRREKEDMRPVLLANIIESEYIIPLLTDPNPAPVKRKGGKPTRKRKHKRKEKKTRRKRSLHNHNLAR